MAAGAATNPSWVRPNTIVTTFNVRPAERVATFGSGAEYLLPLLSARVGVNGRVFAIDTDATAVEGFRVLIEQKNLKNVTPVHAAGGRVTLEERVDKVILMSSYRFIDKKEVFFSTLKKNIKPKGRVAVVDFYRRITKEGPPLKERVASHQVMRELKRFGYVYIRRYNVLPYQYFLLYRVK